MGVRFALELAKRAQRKAPPRKAGAARKLSRTGYRSVANPSGRGFAPWVRALKGKSGAYMIRETDSGEIVYVGESHTATLYKTLTRHFFGSWQRDKDWWKEKNRGAGGERPGNIYDRDTHEVRVTVTSDRWATRLQYKWIKRYNPRDNDTRGMSIDTNRTIPTKDFDDEVPF